MACVLREARVREIACYAATLGRRLHCRRAVIYKMYRPVSTLLLARWLRLLIYSSSRQYMWLLLELNDSQSYYLFELFQNIHTCVAHTILIHRKKYFLSLSCHQEKSLLEQDLNSFSGLQTTTSYSLAKMAMTRVRKMHVHLASRTRNQIVEVASENAISTLQIHEENCRSNK